MSVAPPPAIEERLAALAPRVRALRVARGCAGVVGAALGAACAALLLDAAWAAPEWARGLFLSVWVTAVGVLVWRWVLIPWRADIAPADVAGELGDALPELAARLRSVVSAQPPGQSDAVRTALATDAARRAKAADLAGALSVRPVAWRVALAAGAVLAAVAAAALVPGSAARIRRVALPWHRPPAAPFRIIVTSGEPVVRRGAPVTLSAYAERSGGSPPTEAVVVFRDGPGVPDTRAPMVADGGAFLFQRPNTVADFEYRVEIGSAQSDWFRVTALDPVELADGTRVEIVPPEYAAALGKHVIAPLTDVEGLASGAAHFHLRFTRPAAAVHLEWHPDGAHDFDLLAADLTPDGRGAGATLPLRASGVLKLILVRDEGGKRLRTETTVRVRVARDEPPWFEQVSGLSPRPRTVRPDARVPIAFVARDDLGVAAAVLEYVVGPDESRRVTVPVPLDGAGTPRIAGRIEFDPTGRARVGETVRVRVVVSDGARVEGGPQTAAYPPAGWSELALSAAAPPLDQQDIVCQRDALGDALEGGSNGTAGAADEVAALRAATAGGGALSVDQSARLNGLKDRVRGTADALRAAAREAALVPEMRPLGAEVRAVADEPLRRAEDALRRSEEGATRAEALDTAAAQLGAARGRLDELRARNARFARDRLDRARLTALAAEQTALANRDGPDRLAKQQELLTRLAALVEESEPLRAAVGATRGEDVRRLAAALADLAARVRELDAAARESADELRAALGADLAREQDAVAARAAAVFADLDTAARLAGAPLPHADEFRKAADLATAGRTVEALAELDRHTRAVADLAAAFDRWAADRADPKLGAKQLALWQDDLAARFGGAIKDAPFDALPPDRRAALRAEQAALHDAVGALALPAEVAPARATAADYTRRAADALGKDGAGAAGAMKRASEALARLAVQVPPVGERHTKALRALDPLRQELDASGNAVEQVLRGADRVPPDPAALAKRFGPAAERQRKLIAGVAALDLPALDARRARVLGALAAAVADLQDGSALDVPASQAWARREFERLKLVLEGNPAADAKADELHRKLAALAAALDAHGAGLTRQHLEPATPVLQDVWRQLGGLVAPEAPALVNDARAAAQAAEIAVRDAKPDEARRRVRAAADALDRLADRLNGSESDLERITRLAAGRRLAAEKPKELLFSDEAVRQLGREADELALTRTGPAGQALKRRALDLYARLRARTDPDRIGTDQKALVLALDELAARTADIAELAVANGRGAAPRPAPADRYLPSKPAADALRDLGRRQHALHEQVARFGTELAARLRPAANDPLAALAADQRRLALDALDLARDAAHPAPKAADAALLAADRVRVGQVRGAREAGERAAAALHQLAGLGSGKPWGKRAVELAARQDAIAERLTEALDRPNAVVAQQIARAVELAHEGAELAAALDRAARALAPGDANGRALLDAAERVRGAEARLLDAAKRATDGGTADAEKLRAAAESLVRDAANGVTGVAPGRAPEGVSVGAGEALRAAEKAMRSATDALAPDGNPGAATAAMRDAARALTEAAKKVEE